MVLDQSPAPRPTLSAAERLRGRRHIELLFQTGRAVYADALRALFVAADPAAPVAVQVLFTVSARKCRTAVRRNRIRRLMREAYRRNKLLLLQPLNDRNKKLLVAFQFLAAEPPTYAVMEQNMQAVLKKIKDRLCAG